MIARLALLFLLAAAAHAPAAAAQSPDSVAQWTELLSSGSLAERVHAAQELAGLDARRLPPGTKAAFIEELNRINDLRMAQQPIEGVGNGGAAVPPETLGRYYVDLVATTVALNTEESENAVVRAVAISGGLQRRVARRGDVATPMLVDMIERGYEVGAAVETLGLIWFHADSAGTALLPETRSAIVRQISLATESPSRDVRRSAVLALRSASDPAFLGLAQRFARATGAGDDRYIARAVQAEAVLPLRRHARAATPAELLRRTVRMADAVCHDRETVELSESCALIRARLGEAAERLALSDRAGSAAALIEAHRDAEAAHAAGVLSDVEHALLAGGILLTIDRVR